MATRLQFTLRALLLTVGADALILALMQAPPQVGRPMLIALVPLSSALVATGLMFGRPRMRSFCIGAAIPLGMMLAYMTMHLFELDVWLMETRPGRLPKIFGGGFLTSIALGYVCVGFHWLIERERP
jgi:hypothetical protein